MMRRAVPFLALLAGCGPMTVEQAEDACFDRARLAAKPRGEVALGASTEGPVAKLDLELSSDWAEGRDPSIVYETCVMAKSGEAPRRPLYMRPDWKG